MYKFLLMTVLLVLLLIPVLTISSVIEPCQELFLTVRADIDGQPVQLPLQQPIEVVPGQLITMVAEIKTRPVICEGDLSAEWRLPFTSSSSRIKFTSNAPVTAVVEVPENYQQGEIALTVVQVLSGSDRQDIISQRFKIKEE